MAISKCNQIVANDRLTTTILKIFDAGHTIVLTARQVTL